MNVHLNLPLDVGITFRAMCRDEDRTASQVVEEWILRTTGKGAQTPPDDDTVPPQADQEEHAEAPKVLEDAKPRWLWVLAIVPALFWPGWPVGSYLTSAAFSFLVLDRFALRAAEGLRHRAARFTGVLFAKSATQFAQGMVIGLALVWLLQLGVMVTVSKGSIGSVWAMELAIERMARTTKDFTKDSLVLMPIAFLIFGLAHPEHGIVKKVAKLRGLVGRAAAVLAVVSSFTFFAAKAAKGNVIDWRAEASTRASSAKTTLHAAQARAVAAARTATTLTWLSPQARDDLRAILKRADRSPDREQSRFLEQEAQLVSDQEPPIASSDSPPPAEEHQGIPPSDVAATSRVDDSFGGGDPPSLEDIATVERLENQTSTVADELEALVCEVLKAVAGNALPETSQTVKAFAKQLISNASKDLTHAAVDKVFTWYDAWRTARGSAAEPADGVTLRPRTSGTNAPSSEQFATNEYDRVPRDEPRYPPAQVAPRPADPSPNPTREPPRSFGPPELTESPEEFLKEWRRGLLKDPGPDRPLLGGAGGRSGPGGIRTGYCSCRYWSNQPPPVVCSDPRCGPVIFE